MTCTQRLMKPGSFTVRLAPESPSTVWLDTTVLDHIVILPTHLDPTAHSDADLLAQALYTGVIVTVEHTAEGTVLTGADPSWWLGTPDGVGPVIETKISAATSLSAMLAAVLNGTDSNGINDGTVNDTGTTSLPVDPESNTGNAAVRPWITRREALDQVCTQAGAEWRANPDFSVDAATTANLFVTNPTVVITREPASIDGAYRGVEGDFTALVDATQLARRVVVISDDTSADGSTAGTFTWKDPANQTPTLTRVVNAPTLPNSGAAAVAASLLAGYDLNREFKLSSRTHTVGRFVQPGDYVYAYDELGGLTDTANQLMWRGRLITPIELRVGAITWPIEAGMGVYRRKSAATPTWTDLTPWVVVEDADTTWEVSTVPAASTVGTTLTPGSNTNPAGAYLGENAAITERVVNSGPSMTNSPTWTNVTVGNAPINTMSWRLDGKWCTGRATFKLGNTSAMGTGPELTLPYAYVDGRDIDAGCSVMFYDATGPRYYGKGYATGSTKVGLLARNTSASYESGSSVSATVPFTWTTDDYLIVDFAYEIA